MIHLKSIENFNLYSVSTIDNITQSKAVKFDVHFFLFMNYHFSLLIKLGGHNGTPGPDAFRFAVMAKEHVSGFVLAQNMSVSDKVKRVKVAILSATTQVRCQFNLGSFLIFLL